MQRDRGGPAPVQPVPGDIQASDRRIAWHCLGGVNAAGGAKERGRLRPRYTQPLHIPLAGVAVEQTRRASGVYPRFYGIKQC